MQWEWCICWFILFAGRGQVCEVCWGLGWHAFLVIFVGIVWLLLLPLHVLCFQFGGCLVEQVIWGILFIHATSDSLHVVYLLASVLCFTCFH